MNIIAVPYNSKGFYLRPDTTLNRNWGDFYVPDFVTSLSAIPFAYVKICKAGKAILQKFAERYYGTVEYGIAVRAVSINEKEPVTFSVANSFDYSTYLSEDRETSSDLPEFSKNGIPVCRLAQPPKEDIEQAIEKITSIISIRYGDILLFELHEGVPVIPGDKIGLDNSGFSIK